jgi:outer membrane protein TolC
MEMVWREIEAVGTCAEAVVMGRRMAASASACIAALLLAFLCQSCRSDGFATSERHGSELVRVEQRLGEETAYDASEPNSLAYRRAVGEEPARWVERRRMTEPRVLTLEQCLQLAFTSSNEIEQFREQMFLVGGTRLIASSRFLPTVDLIGQFEHARAFEAADRSADASQIGARISQRILEWGKDNPIDLALRSDQRDALFRYEDRVAIVLSQVRRAFLFVQLKDEQIAARQELLKQFETQARIKQQRMDAGNLSVKIEVLTAQLNVLNEKTRINQLESEKFNRKAELLRLVGLPVGASQVEFQGRSDDFGLDGFDMEGMIHLALAQNSELAFREALVAEQGRALGQLRYEYLPDLRVRSGYQDEFGRAGAEVRNIDDTWGLDLIGEPGVTGSSENTEWDGLGYFGPGVNLPGPDPGWFGAVQLGIPIAEGRARTGRRIQARAALNAAVAAADDQQDRIELNVRQGYKFLSEQKFQVDLAQENVNIEKERFQIQEELRNAGKITDDQLETFRTRFFSAQDNLFDQQERLIERQEDLRLAIRYFK